MKWTKIYKTQNYRPGSQIDMTARLTSYQRSLTVAWGTSIYFRDQICRGKASAKRFQPAKRQKVVDSYWTDNLFSIFLGFQEHHLRVYQLDDFSFIRRICPGNWQCAILFGKCEIAPQPQRSVVGQEKQNCCIPGKFIVIPKHTEREKMVPQSNSIGGLPLGCKDWPWEVFKCPVAFGDRQCENSRAVLLLPTRFRIHLPNYPWTRLKSKIPNSAHIWLSSSIVHLSSVHEKILGLFPMPISIHFPCILAQKIGTSPAALPSSSVRTSLGSLAAWSLDRSPAVCRRPWHSPRLRAVFARSPALRPKRIPRRGTFRIVSPWNPPKSRHPCLKGSL